MTAQAIVPIRGTQEAKQCLKCSADGSRNQDILETIEDMALRNEEKEWVREEIAAAIQEHLQPHGWRRLGSFLKTWIPLGSALGILIALLALAGAGWNYSLSRVDKEARFQTTTEATLKTVQADIAEIKTNLTKQSLVSHAALPLADFKATLSDLGSSIAAAKKQDLKVPPKVVDGLAQKMSAIDKNTSDFWPVAGALISYRSSLLVGSSRDWSATFPKCSGTVDLLGADKNATVQRGEGGKLVGPKVLIERIGNQDCYVELDGKRVSKWDCTRCLVKYSGGPLSLTDVHFEDCLFIFDLRSQPAAPDGIRLSKVLLASTSQNFHFPGG